MTTEALTTPAEIPTRRTARTRKAAPPITEELFVYSVPAPDRNSGFMVSLPYDELVKHLPTSCRYGPHRDMRAFLGAFFGGMLGLAVGALTGYWALQSMLGLIGSVLLVPGAIVGALLFLLVPVKARWYVRREMLEGGASGLVGINATDPRYSHPLDEAGAIAWSSTSDGYFTTQNMTSEREGMRLGGDIWHKLEVGAIGLIAVAIMIGLIMAVVVYAGD